MRTLAALAAMTVALATVLAACGPASTPGASATPEVRTAPEAAAAVAASNPLFGGILERDANLIGQGESWEATPADAADPPTGWMVVYEVGWGDCQSGCIDRHMWTYTVARNGTVAFQGETGSPLTDEVIAARLAAATSTGVGGRVTAGPVCPVERPGDPNCAARAVAGAVLVIKGANGAEVARLTTDASGLYRVSLAPGDYTLEAQPVEGLMGTPSALPFTVRDGAQTALDVVYDTGIR